MKGIIFTEPNFLLTIRGLKKQTRRLIKSRTGFFEVCSKGRAITGIWQTDADGWTGDDLIPVKPRYKAGETVYLKEPYAYAGGYFEHENPTLIYKYMGNPANYSGVKWKNKRFMPQCAARYFIKITAVRSERLQDISDADCESEGICPVWESGFIVGWSNKQDGKVYDKRQQAYASLFDKINGKGTWEENPFVWVYDYELMK